MSFPPFTALDREWRRFSCDPATTAALHRWQTTEPVLAGFTSVDEVVAARSDSERAPGVLSALVGIALTDPIAARVLLQAALPGLVRLAVKLSVEGRPDVAEHVLAIAWEKIRSYGAGNRGPFAPNLLLDVRKAIVAEWAGETTGTELPAAVGEAPAAEDEVLSRVFLDEVAALERAGELLPGSTELIVRTRIEGHTLVEVAARMGSVSDHGLLLRRQRAEARLRRQLEAA